MDNILKEYFIELNELHKYNVGDILSSTYQPVDPARVFDNIRVIGQGKNHLIFFVFADDLKNTVHTVTFSSISSNIYDKYILDEYKNPEIIYSNLDIFKDVGYLPSEKDSKYLFEDNGIFLNNGHLLTIPEMIGIYAAGTMMFPDFREMHDWSIDLILLHNSLFVLSQTNNSVAKFMVKTYLENVLRKEQAYNNNFGNILCMIISKTNVPLEEFTVNLTNEKYLSNLRTANNIKNWIEQEKMYHDLILNPEKYIK